MWMLHDNFMEVVKTNWLAPIYPDNAISGMKRLWLKLKRLKTVLKWWNHHVFKNLFTNILNAEDKVNNFEKQCQLVPSEDNFILLREAKVTLSNLQAQEEIFWKQKAAVKHLVEGDNNTKYFHALVKRKRAINRIQKINREDGSSSENETEIADLAVHYFQNHLNKTFSSSISVNHNIIPRLISHDDNAFLHFELVSGLALNKQKCSFIPAKKVPLSRIRDIKSLTGFSQGFLPLKYLGVPLFKGRKKSFLFDDLISSLQKRFLYWDSNFLSFGGRLTLIKSVLYSIPLFAIGLIGSLIGFFWKGASNNSKILWASWDNCCGVLEEGALGYKSMHDLAYSFSVKLWFNLRANSSLWAKFMVSKYCGNNHPIMSYWNKGNSSVWKRLCKIKWVVEPTILWGLGEGNIFFWQDRWLNGQSIDSILNTNSISQVNVNYFFNNNNWDVEKLLLLLPEGMIHQILQIDLNIYSNDIQLSASSKNGNFRLKMLGILFVSKIFHLFWHKSIPSTVSIFIWRLVHKFIPTDDILIKKGFIIPSKCQCCFHIDSLHHVFISSLLAIKVWIYFEDLFQLNIFNVQLSIVDMLKLWFVDYKGHIRNIIPSLILWYLWMEKNNSRFNGIAMCHLRIIQNVNHKIGALYSANLISGNSFKNYLFSMEAFGINLPMVNSQRLPRAVVWLKPLVNVFKLNVDTVSINSVWGCGGLIRDSNGDFILGFAGPSPISDVKFTINYTILYSLRLFLSLGITNVVIEVSSNLFVNAKGNVCANVIAIWGCALDAMVDLIIPHLSNRITGLIALDKIGSRISLWLDILSVSSLFVQKFLSAGYRDDWAVACRRVLLKCNGPSVGFP
ncbi:hypothetical protein M5K25_025491 [Dendrobium thyrsiflorum]|uniref:Reverse transcriptase zinc-binding domain-containing protein n=1 Tax=Dendrobium thyrsiflorum TaxID=117978 RepID=A0ABD0U9J8_DENTH